MNTIRRSDAIDALIKEYPYINPTSITNVIMHVEDADPERPTGRWIYGEDDNGQDGWTCSECGFFVPWYYKYYGFLYFIRDYHTCPHCDAKMEVEHER